jgi:hypothetical protein
LIGFVLVIAGIAMEPAIDGALYRRIHTSLPRISALGYGA